MVKVAPMELLAGSETMGSNGNYGDGNGITLGSRGGSLWDDDEE